MLLTPFLVAAFLLSLSSTIISLVALGRTKGLPGLESELSQLAPIKERFEVMDEDVIRSVMEEGKDASVEAVLQTMARLMEMDDGTLGAGDALRQAREMHKR